MSAAITSFSGEYRFLSNFWPVEVTAYGEKYPSVEHAYQAAKTLDLRQREIIRKLPSAAQAKRAGRTVTMRPNWEQHKLRVMRTLLERKFRDDTLGEKLLDTLPLALIEGNAWGDTFWGVCNGKGHNHLGKLLMEVRESLLPF